MNWIFWKANSWSDHNCIDKAISIVLPLRVDCINQRFKTALFCSSEEVDLEATNPSPSA